LQNIDGVYFLTHPVYIVAERIMYTLHIIIKSMARIGSTKTHIIVGMDASLNKRISRHMGLRIHQDRRVFARPFQYSALGRIEIFQLIHSHT